MILPQGDSSDRTKLLSNGTSSKTHFLYSAEHNEISVNDATTIPCHSKSNESTANNESPQLKLEQKLKKKSDFLKLPRRKLMILGYNTFGRLIMNAAASIFNPIFPIEAKEKAIDGFWVKLTFGILYVVVFLTSPLFGRYLSKIGPNFVLLSSLYVAGVVNLFFAFLHYGPGGTSYLVLVILNRCLFAITRAGYSTVTQAVVFYEFQGNMAIAQSILQSGKELGFVIGPALAGLLYQGGGFSLPFYVIGGALIITAIVTHLTLPNVNDSIKISTNGNRVSAFTLMKSPLMTIPLLCLTVGVVGVTNITITLTDMLLPFGLSMSSIGLVFVIMDCLNSPGTFFWAYITDKLNKEGVAILLGLFLYFIGYSTLGPATFLPFIPHNVTTVCLAVGIIGVAFGSSFIPIMKCLLMACKEMGYQEDDFDAMSVVSGLFNTFLTLGGFSGQFVMGLVGNAYGISVMYTAIAFMNAGAFFITAPLFVYRKSKSKSDSSCTNDKVDSISISVHSGHW